MNYVLYLPKWWWNFTEHDFWNVLYLSNCSYFVGNLRPNISQTCHQLHFHLFKYYNCLSWNFLILFQFDSQILKLWKHGFDFVYTRLSRLGVVSIKWPKHYYLENSRTRNSKQSVYNRRSTNVLLKLFNCIINVNLPNNGMLYYGLIDE